MAYELPTVQEIRESLEALSFAEVKSLCEKCSVPFTTAWKLRTGVTTDPRIETVRALWPDLKPPKSAKKKAA
jgi:hypothetical protein